MEMEMVLAVVGDRHYSDYGTFSKIMDDELERFPATRIITGDSSGTDTMAYSYAQSKNIPLTIYCANRNKFLRFKAEGADAVLVSDWGSQGKAAGPLRNVRVVTEAGKVLLFDGGGPGSSSVKRIAKRLSKEVEEWRVVTATGRQIAISQINHGVSTV